MGTGTPVTTGEKITAAKMNLKLESINDVGQLPNRWARPGKAYASNGTTKKDITGTNSSYVMYPANADKILCYLVGDGTETRINISMEKGPGQAIFDLYVNDILLQAGNDNYSAIAGQIGYHLNLNGNGKEGTNKIEFRVNGRNASATGWFISTYSCSFQ